MFVQFKKSLAALQVLSQTAVYGSVMAPAGVLWDRFGPNVTMHLTCDEPVEELQPSAEVSSSASQRRSPLDM